MNVYESIEIGFDLELNSGAEGYEPRASPREFHSYNTCQNHSPSPGPGRPNSQWGSGAATDRVLGEFAGREKKKETSLLPFFQVFFTCSKRNRTWSSEICVTDRSHYAKRSKPVCKFVTFSRPTDRLFSSPPSARPPLEIRAALASAATALLLLLPPKPTHVT